MRNISHSLRLGLAPFASAFRHWSLLKGFASREIRGRFAGSFAGVLWTLIHPLATIGVYTFLFSIILRVPVTRAETGTDSFVIFFLAGLFPWLLFADSLTRSAGSLVGNANLITKVVFPVELLPTSALLSTFLVNGIGLLIFLGALLVKGYGHWSWVWIPPLLFIQTVLTWGAVMLLSALTVFIRDIQELLGIVLTIWFYATPILYPASFVPAGIRGILAVNPLAHLVTCYRGALLTHQVDPITVAVLAVIAGVCYMGGAWFFMRAKAAFGDVL
jgi:lipopolysaccharide transport system permease protein